MKRDCQLILIAGSDYLSIDLGQDFSAIFYRGDIRRADKTHRDFADALEVCGRIKAPQLSAVGISFYIHWHGS